MAPIITNTRTTVITIYIVFTKHLLLNNLSAATWSVDLVAVDLTVGPDVHYDEDSGGDEKDPQDQTPGDEPDGRQDRADAP